MRPVCERDSRGSMEKTAGGIGVLIRNIVLKLEKLEK
jgi:hypothetical protein